VLRDRALHRPTHLTALNAIAKLDAASHSKVAESSRCAYRQVCTLHAHVLKPSQTPTSCCSCVHLGSELQQGLDAKLDASFALGQLSLCEGIPCAANTRCQKL
jgi:hypothetical protein